MLAGVDADVYLTGEMSHVRRPLRSRGSQKNLTDMNKYTA
jgi:hypothetical protein